MSTTKGTEGISNEEGAPTEVKVKTVNYRSPAGQEQGAQKEKVDIIHRIDDDRNKEGTTGVISQTAAKVAEKIQPAKEAISGTHDQKSK